MIASTKGQRVGGSNRVAWRPGGSVCGASINVVRSADRRRVNAVENTFDAAPRFIKHPPFPRISINGLACIIERSRVA